MELLGQAETLVDVPPELWSLALAGAAVVVAIAALIFTYLHARAIRDAEAREREWQAERNERAYVEVTRLSERLPRMLAPLGEQGATAVFVNSDRIRLRNTGSAAARYVLWEIGEDVLSPEQRTSLEVLYPGEHYDMYIYPDGCKAPDTEFTVWWTDPRGRHETNRIVNL